MALAQKSVAEILGRTATPEGPPKTYLEEIMLFSYVEYKIWRGLVGRLEYRHDQANRNAFSVRNVGGRGLAPTSDAQNTITVALYYSFF